jgi:subtilisin-like proprotein convertase family protein
MSIFSFRRFFSKRWTKRKDMNRRKRKPARRSIPFLESLENRLAPATVPDVLPAALVNSQFALTGANTNINPQVVMDPVNTSKFFEVHSIGGNFGGNFSEDGGGTWASFNNTAAFPNLGLPQTTIDPISVAMDRNEEVYVAFSYHSADFTSGAIEFTRFNFSSSLLIQDLGIQTLYTWSNSDAAYNPTVIVDNNLPSFSDPHTGAQVTDTMVGKAVYVVWNTDWKNSDGSTDSAINVAASENQGLTFSNPVRVGGAQGNHPVGFFTQGTADGRIPGGQLNIFADGLTNPNTNTSGANLNQSRPDNGQAGQNVVSAVSFLNGSTGAINEATSGGGPATTTYTLTLTSSQFPTDFGGLNNLDVMVGLVHADVRELSAKLSHTTSNGTVITVTLFNNHIAFGGGTLNQGIPGSSAVANLGEIGGVFPGTVFDNVVAHRSITDPSNVAPFIGTYKPEVGTLASFDGLTATDLAGTWTLTITDNVADSGTLTQNVGLFGLRFTSTITSGFGSDSGIGIGALPSSSSTVYPTAAPSATPGVGPNLAVAFDNSLGSFSPHQGTMYMAYTGPGSSGLSTDTNVYLATSTDGGASWSSGLRINNDNAFDGFSEGDRTQFMPELAVDPVTGTLVATWYDARYDASNARVATILSTSIDGGNTFSPAQVYLNSSVTAKDAITGQVLTIEPVPSNGPNAGAQGFGDHQGLAVYAGHVIPFWSGNNNDVGTAIYTANVTIAAGPRILQGDQGPIGQEGTTDSQIVSFAADGTPMLTGFRVTFDRPVDPGTFTTSEVQLHYHNPSDPAPVFTDLSGQVTGVQALDAGLFGATQFLITITPQSAVGDYSYAIGPTVSDRIRTTTSNGNLMDQNMNAVPGEANGTNGGSGDLFAIPGPINPFTTPAFQVAYDPTTVPLIIPGPHVVSSTIPGIAPTGDNLIVNGTVSAIDVVFDRDMNTSTFEQNASAVLRIVGPNGAISGPFTVTPNPSGTPPALANRTFRIGFPTQSLSGTYSIVVSPINPADGTTIQDTHGNAIDTDLNAGLDTLRGNSFSATVGAPINYTTTVSKAINANSTVNSTITINDQFIIQQDSINHIRLRLNITSPSSSPINDPDLIATLISPDGRTMIPLFTKVGNVGPLPHANFSNTTFDDFATSPIELAAPPFDIGPFTPQLLLSQIKGLSSKGTWTLRIKNVGSTSGTLTDWSLLLPPPLLGTGLGDPIADQTNVNFRIFTQDPTNVLSHNQLTAVGGAALTNASPNDHSGRIGGLAVDPSDPSGNTVYAAGASGGVWKTNNFLSPNGPTWVPLTDLGPGTSLNISSIAVFARNNDTNQSIIFATTGEGDTGTPGVGLLRSMDGGKTWTLLDSLDNTVAFSSRAHDFVGKTSFKVIVDPKVLPGAGFNVAVYAAFAGASGGVYRSIDTGNHWQLVQAGDVTDIVLAAGSAGSGGGNLSVLYAAIRGTGIFRTTSALTAVSMTQLTGGDGFPTRRNIDNSPDTAIPVTNPSDTPNGAKGRIVLATPTLTNSPFLDSNYQGWLYALVINTNSGIDDLYLTKDFGHNWTRLVIPFFKQPNGGTFPTNDETKSSPYDPFNGSINGTSVAQGNYDVSMAIDPTNPNIVYIGGMNDLAPSPAGGMIRIDVTTLDDPYALIQRDNSNNDGGLVMSATTGSFAPDGLNSNYGITSSENQNYYNIAFDPIHPHLTPSSLPFVGVGNFLNAGDDLRWGPVDESFLLGSTDQHRLLALTDPATGKTRLIAGDDQGIFTSLINSDGTLFTSPGSEPNIFGTRNGNIQITQFYHGTSQPSSLAAEIQGALFYGMAQDDGFPTSDPHVLDNGNIGWVGPAGDGTGVATDQTGSGQVYEYRWPCCGASPLASDFFLVQMPGAGQPFLSRVTGLLLPGDDPATGAGEWPLVGGSNFAVNAIDPTAIVMSSQSGKVFRTSGPLTGTGIQWFEIDNGQLDGTYAPAEAFGAPNPATPGVLDDFIYVGTTAGNIFVTTTGGTSWTNISSGLDGTPVQYIVTDPTHGSDDAYAVTLKHVYFTQHATASTFAGWTNITGNLFSLTTTLFGGFSEPSNPLVGSTLVDLHALAVDWRFNKGGSPPVLYVGGQGGIYRSDNQGSTWRYFPDVAHEKAAVDGGLMANTTVTQLSLALGNIDPATGLPKQADGTGFNLLLATTYGRGMFAIRLDQDLTNTNNPPPGPVVNAISNVSDSSTEAIQVTFGKTVSGTFVPTPVDPATMNAANITIKDPNGHVIPVRQVVDLTPGPATNGHTVYEVFFTGTTAGSYTITIGTNVSGFAGNKLDQDQDSVNGASDDKFTGSVSITPAARPTVGLPYIDSFAGAYGSALARQWVETQGRFSIQNNPASSENVAVAQNTWPNTAILQLATAQANVTVQSDINVTSTNNAIAGLLARYIDGNNFFQAAVQNSNGTYVASISRVVGGVVTQLANATLTSGAGTLRLEVVDESLKLFWNDHLVTYAYDNLLTTAGNIGIQGSQGVSFANFNADVITLLTAPVPFNDSFQVPGPGSQLDRYWIDQFGNISVSNGQAVGTGGNNLSTVNGLNLADVTVSADVNLTSSNQAAGLVTRYSGPLYNNFYLGQIVDIGSGFKTEIFKNIGGTFTQLAVGTVVNTGTGRLELETVGPSVKLLFNGVLVAFADDLSLTSGSVGMRLSQTTAADNFNATAIVKSTPSLPFKDDFSTTSDGSQLDSNWTDQFGNISVSNGKAVGTAGNNLSTVNGLNQADVAVSIDVNLTSSNQAAGLVTRYGGPLYNNFYLAQIVDIGSGFKTEIFENIGGTFTQLAVGSVVNTGTGTLEFEAVGPSLKLIFNGVLVAFADDLSLTSGSVGMRLSQNTTADNFNASAVVQTTPPLPFKDDFSMPSDGSQLSRNWTDQFGNITISGGQAVGTAGNNLSTVNGLNQADVAVSIDVNLTSSNQAAGLVTRYSGPLYNNFYLGQIVDIGSGFKTEIFKNIGGTFTQLAVGTVVNTGTGTLELESVGQSVKLIFNGTLVAYAFDGDLTSGSVGMRLSQTTTADNFNAAAVVQTTPPLPFKDDFSMPSDGSQLSRNWSDQFGNISISSGQAVGTAGNNLSTVNGLNQPDVAVSIDVNLTSSNQAAGLVTRYSGPLYNNFYLGQIVDTGSGFKTEIFKNIGGTFTQLAVGSVVNTGIGTLEFEAAGPSLKLIFNSTLVAFADDLSLTGGSVGMRLSQTTTADNFNAAAIVQTTPPLTFKDDFSMPSDGSQLSRNWTDQSGNITISSGQAVGTAGYNLSIVNGINKADITVSADINLTSSNQAAGLVTRYGGLLDSNYYLAHLFDTGSGFKAEIYKNIGGVFTQLALGSSTSGMGTLTFKVHGSNLELDLNGTVLVTAIDTSLTTGSVGMRLSQGTTMDNFMAS